MTDRELAVQVAAKLAATSLTYAEWRKKVRANGPAYEAASNWGKAFKLLDAIDRASVPPPVVTPPSGLLAPYRSIIFAGQNPLDALGAPAYYRVAFTADPAYDSYATRDAADQLRAAGHEVYVWYVPTEVTGARAGIVHLRLGATKIIGQCESGEQFNASVEHGLTAMVGNLAALDGFQLAQVAAGTRVVVNELYRNCNGNQQPDWRGANAGVPGNCVACYQDGDCSRMPLSQYIADGMFTPHRDSLYGPGLTADDYAALRAAG